MKQPEDFIMEMFGLKNMGGMGMGSNDNASEYHKKRESIM